MRIHIVQRGDTLWKISRNYGVSFDELKRLNAHLANPEYIVPGMKIFIPDEKKMESMNHPYSNNHRPVKKEMMKEEVKVQPSMQQQQYHPKHPPVKQYQPMAPSATCEINANSANATNATNASSTNATNATKCHKCRKCRKCHKCHQCNNINQCQPNQFNQLLFNRLHKYITTPCHIT